MKKQKLQGFALLMSFFETQELAANAIGVKQCSISYWKKHGIPRHRRVLVVSVLADMGVIIEEKDLKNAN